MTGIPTLMGATEIGRALGGKSKQRVNGIVNDRTLGFPAPVVDYLACGRLWREADVRRWVEGSSYAWHEWRLDDGT